MLARVLAHLFLDFVCPLPSPKFLKYSSVAAQVNFMILEKKIKEINFETHFCIGRRYPLLILFLIYLSLYLALDFRFVNLEEQS